MKIRNLILGAALFLILTVTALAFGGFWSGNSPTLATLGGVPTSTIVNGHALSGNVAVTPTDLSLVIGTNVEAWSANLDGWSAIAPSSKQAAGTYAGLAANTFTGAQTVQGVAANDNPVVGSSYFTTGSWTSTGWTGSGNGPWTNTSSNTAALSFSATCSNATVYRVNLVTSGTYGSGTVTVTFGGKTQTITATGTIDWYPLTSATTHLVVTPPGTFTGTIAFTITPLTASTPTIQLNTSGAVDAVEVRESSSLGNTFIGLNSGEYNTTGINNTSYGTNALMYNTTGNYNTANGYQALQNNTTGISNTANGYNALLSNTTGSNNTANGYQALQNNTTGGSNTANGYAALYNNTTGSNNTANGYNALYYNTTGSSNTANGYESLFYNTTGGQNTANGYAALYNNTTGNNNTANGIYALQNNTTGSYNTANGTRALYYNTTGNYNTAYGYGSLYSNTTNVATLGSITGGSLYTTGTYTGVVMTLSSGSSAITYPTATIVVNGGGAVSSVTITSPGAGFQDTTTVLTAPAASIGGTGSGFSVPVASLNAAANNTALGYQAGEYISGGSVVNSRSTNSTYLGMNTYGLADGDINETVIGYGAVGNGSNTVTLGGSGTTGTIVPYGNVGIGTTAPSNKLSVQDSTVLGTESCAYPTTFSNAVWTLAGDFAVNGSAATFTESSGSGTITQTAANQAQVSAGNRWYQIQYIVSATPTVVGATMTLTTGFASSSTTLPIVAGTNTILFRSAAAPANIVLSVSGATSGAFTLTSISVKEVQGGSIALGADIKLGPTLMPAGTTGNVTINKSSGQVRIAAAGTTVTVTNNLVTANSIIMAMVASNDTTAQVKNVVPTAASFTINMVAGVTAETPISFLIIN